MIKWSAKETIFLNMLMEKHGRNWAIIAPKLDRSTASVRNRVSRLGGHRSKRKAKCLKCGQVRAGHVCPVELGVSTPDDLLADFSRVCGDDVPQPIERSDSVDSDDAERFAASVFSDECFVDVP